MRKTLAPNPSDGVFQVQYAGQDPLVKIENIDLTGKVIEELDPESPIYCCRRSTFRALFYPNGNH